MTFREMGLSSEILKGIEALGFENATPIQEKVIPYLLKNKRDLIGLAQTGTGKTAAFGLPSLENLDLDNRNPQLLVLSPTRELCLQITNDLNNYGSFIEGLHIVAVYGGADISRQIKSLRDGAHIIVATPGRIHDLVRRQRVNLSEVKTLVLDEADEMLKMGFREDVDAILAKTPQEKNTLLFSATMSPEVLAITKNYMTDPMEITIGQKNSGAENVSHIYHMVHSKDRYEALKRVVDNYPDMYAIVFCRTRQEAKDVAASLMRDGYNADALHGDLSQSQRDFVMQKFREKTLSVLVGTDVAARGLDVNNLTHVINYNLPDDLEVYTHRSGRTGRAGKEGIAISIINMKERGYIAQIEKSIHKKIAFMPVPTGKEICERRLFDMIEHMQKITVDHGQIDLYIDKAYEMLSDIPKEEIIKRFVYVEFSRFLDYYKNSPDLNNDHREPRDSEGRSSGKGKNKGKSMSRIVLNIGKGKNITKKEIINLVASTPSSRNVEIGLIEIYKKASSVEVESKMSKAIVSELNEKKYKGIEIKAEENYEFTGVSQDDRDWEPRHKKSFRSGDKNGRSSFSKEKRGDKPGFKGKGPARYPKTYEKRDRGQGGRR